ncbi:3-dehydroquinate synthase [Paenibacillus macerans]|nr:3-dehydroquinate synthase [Paenibacillus macerans]
MRDKLMRYELTGKRREFLLMTQLLHNIRQQAAALGEEYLKAIDLDEIRVEPGALGRMAAYLERKNCRSVIVAADRDTYEAAGKLLLASMERAEGLSGTAVHTTMIRPDAEGDVIADEASLIQLILDIQRYGADAVIAVGGGTLHDICRFSAYTTGIPFISVPTAPSVDGFNSKGAPILLRGEKTTIPAIGPMAIFADLDILVQAPAELAAAGFGDMLGKYTSLFDWSFGALAAGEPYLPAAAEITRSALQKCVAAAGLIASRSEEGIHALMSALIESGLAMLLFGQSHPASGAEHHLSHYWEMEYLRLGRRQLLHGAKVGVASMEIAKLYRRIAAEGLPLNEWAAHRQAEGQSRNQSQAGSGKTPVSSGNVGSARGRANGRSTADFIRAENVKPAPAADWERIRREIGQIPDPQELGGLLALVGGPVSVKQLGVSPELLERSLREAHLVRPGRHTLLRAYNEMRAK